MDAVHDTMRSHEGHDPFIFDEPMVSGKTNANVFTIILLDGRRFFVRNKIPEGTFIIQQPKLDLFAIQ